MAITPNFLSQCTDEQINRGVAWLEAKAAIINSYGNWWRSVGEPNIIYKGSFSNHFQPCVWPNDIMPIAFANGIGMYSHTKNKIDVRVTDMWAGRVEYYSSLGQYRSVYSKNANPLRAICEVYILMMVAK